MVNKNNRRSIWRVTKPKRWKAPTKPEPVDIIMPDGRAARCATGTHSYDGKKYYPEREVEKGVWLKQYIPYCTKCGEPKFGPDGKPLLFDGERVRQSIVLAGVRVEDDTK